MVPIPKHANIFNLRRPMVATVFGGVAVMSMGLLVGTPAAFATPSSEAVNAIQERFEAFTAQNSFLGTPVGDAVDVGAGARQDYTGGSIFYSKESGAHVMYGAILDKFNTLGGPDGSGLGFPTNDEGDSGDGVGRVNDFTKPGGASIFWNPATGAWVISGKVLEAWKISGGTKGPFGYPTSDIAEVNGVSSAQFAGPEGTEIRWSDKIGLATVPAALAASIPGLSAPTGTLETTAAATTTVEGTTSVSIPATTATAPTVDVNKKGFNWWPVVIALAVVALLAGLLAALGRRRKAETPVVRAPEVRPPAPRVVDTPAPPKPEVKAPVIPPAPPVRPVPPPPPPKPAPPKPVVEEKLPPPPPRPVAPPPPPRPVAPPPPPAPEPVKLVETKVDQAAAPLVVNFADPEPTAGPIQVTYENNALGDNQQSRDDKSDSIPD